MSVGTANATSTPAVRELIGRAMPPVRVAVVVTRFIAGAGVVALRGALALDTTRYRVTILAGSGGHLLDEARAAGMEVVTLQQLRPELDPRADRRGYRELVERLSAGRFDVVHTNSAKAGALGRLAARRAAVPAVVHTFHGFPFHEFQSPLRRRAYITVERRLGRLTDHFLAVGAAVAAEAIRLRLAPPEHITTIGNAVEMAAPLDRVAARARARRLLGIPQEVPLVGTVARLDRQKAPHDLVAAMAALRRRDVWCVWIGDGPLRQVTERAAARAGLGDRFVVAGERREISELLCALDVFVMPSLYEGLPCALAEAMACGVPVVATAVNAVPELVVAGRTGILVPPAAPALLARGIDHLLADPVLSARLAARARRRVGEDLGAAALGSDLDDAYSRALRRRGAPDTGDPR